MLHLGTLKSFDSTNYRAEVQLAGSMAAYLDNIPVARNIAIDQMIVGRHVILATPQGNPRDACVIAVWEGAAGGGGGFQSHSARHENGGADELSVAGLSGELADPQKSNFLKLSDTPAAFTGQAGKYPKVNVGEDALEFAAGGGGASNYLALTDTPAAFADKALKFPRVNSAEDALEFGRVGDWVLPTGNNDPDSHWTDEVKAYDKDTGTYTYEGAMVVGWNKFIEFTNSAIDCDKVRVYADYNPAWGVDSIDIDVYYSGAWYDVYEGAIDNGAWVVKDIPGGEQSVTKVRIRYSHTDLAYGMRIFEVSFWQVGLAAAAGGGGGATTFLGLTDTPASFAGEADKFANVNAGETALEFTAVAGLLHAIATTNIYCCWSNRVSDTPRTATVSSVAGDVLTLTGNHAYRFGEWVAGRMDPDNVLLKMQNTTKSEFAWVKGIPAANQLQVTNAADISGWQNGDTISTDQGGGAGSNAIELDISPLIPAGATAVFVSIDFDDTGGAAQVGVSTNGIGGTWLWAKGGTTKGGTSHPFCPIDADRHISVCDKAFGVDTLRMNVKCVAYIK